MKDPYKILGIEENASEGELKKAYRKMVMKYHPDKNKEGKEMFQKISAAYKGILKKNGFRNFETNFFNFYSEIRKDLKSWVPQKSFKKSVESAININLLELNKEMNFNHYNKTKEMRILPSSLKRTYIMINSYLDMGKEQGINEKKYLESLKRREKRFIRVNEKNLKKNYSLEKEEILNNIKGVIRDKSPAKDLKITTLESKVLASIFMLFLFGIFFFGINSMTGAVVLSKGFSSFSFFGIFLFILCIAMYFFIKKIK